MRYRRRTVDIDDDEVDVAASCTEMSRARRRIRPTLWRRRFTAFNCGGVLPVEEGELKYSKTMPKTCLAAD
uniref:Uncharacterized protein n=1 Tax=Vespula pensylvanica TaxID=30213 RepID=A0A834KWM1_VESPE|nr:hypothetical protein H0235_013143 [Vespula pensylvanica]